MVRSLSVVKLKLKKNIVKQRLKRQMKATMKKEMLNNLRRELENSTTHGLSYIFDRNINWLERLFWLVSFLFSLVIVYTLLSSQFIRFINSPTVMSVEMDYLEWNISYPALTLCPIIKSNFTTFKTFVDDISKKSGMYLETYVWAISTAAIYNLDTLALNDPTVNNSNPINPEDYAKTAALMFSEFDKSALTINFNYTFTIQSAMTEMGMCHVINSNVAVFDNPLNWNNHTIPYVKNNVELSVFDSSFYSEILNDGIVSEVYIHSPDEPILSTTPSYTIDSDGFMTYGFQIWSTKISKELQAKSLQIRKCRFLNEPMSSRYPVYSYNNCLLECRIKLILKLCGCVPHFYKATVNERTCKLSELHCFVRYKREIMSLSVTAETIKKFSNSDKLPKSSKDCGCLSSCETDIYRKDREDFTSQTSESRLRIIISSFPKSRIVRDVIFSFSDIFLRSGGVINTCIGTSVISLMELFLIFIRVIIFIARMSI